MAIRKRLVCIIDDDPLVCDALQYALQDQGFDVVVAQDSSAGLSLARESDCVLTDLNMPGSDAIALIGTLRRERPDLHIIAMTGGSFGASGDLVRQACDAGAKACLQKPFKPSELLRVVNAALQAEQP